MIDDKKYRDYLARLAPHLRLAAIKRRLSFSACGVASEVAPESTPRDSAGRAIGGASVEDDSSAMLSEVVKRAEDGDDVLEALDALLANP